jgi:hypothetical protein
VGVAIALRRCIVGYMSTPTYTGGTPMEFTDRLSLAQAKCQMVFQERDGFISDDDLLDIAQEFTISDLVWAEDESEDDRDARLADRDGLIDALYAYLESGPEWYVVDA